MGYLVEKVKLTEVGENMSISRLGAAIAGQWMDALKCGTYSLECQSQPRNNNTVNLWSERMESNAQSRGALDQVARMEEGISAVLLGAYGFRPGSYARGGMPRMMRWPR